MSQKRLVEEIKQLSKKLEMNGMSLGSGSNGVDQNIINAKLASQLPQNLGRNSQQGIYQNLQFFA